jgi:hypothetical protein
MAEIEIGVMRRQCLDRRIESGVQIRWMFSTDQACTKMAKS